MNSVVIAEQDCCLGLEYDVMSFIGHMVYILRELKRVLRNDGTVWLNIGDSYNAAGRVGHGSRVGYKQGTNRASAVGQDDCRPSVNYLKQKDLLGIPWRLAFALQADGWYLRSDIIWKKLNPMPESVTDRPTNCHEHIFLLAKSPRYFYDAEAIKVPFESSNPNSDSYRKNGKSDSRKKHLDVDGIKPGFSNTGMWQPDDNGRNKRDVWSITTRPFKGAHFACFPPELPEICIKAGTSEKGCCPECGKPWNRLVDKSRMVDGEKTITSGWEQDDAGRIGAQGVGHWRITTESSTIGWVPGCDCCGVEIISNPPKKPGENSKNYKSKLKKYEKEIKIWNGKWSELEPAYEKLFVVPCIILDPFAGSGTTMVVAEKLKRIGLGIDCNPTLKTHYRNRKAGKDVSNIKSLEDY